MNDFLFIFRTDYGAMPTGTPEEAQAATKKWMDWVAGIAAQNKLVDRGNRLKTTGAVLRPNNIITNGPYTEIKESIGGYTMVRASSLEEATELAKGCPILQMGGNVEIREVNPL